ncbi:MAG: hypothetical protein A2284_11485 [Deltaproteobacteria bacterium RIFOXYA12_FULL_61_11]|nr:MAG: hypothetical protein A2284_11485 [Deltaproteobacteria bacterium RIFOXYA12_FULL_61_11]
MAGTITHLSSNSAELGEFAERILGLHGAEVEPVPGGSKVLLPTDLARRLEVPEWFALRWEDHDPTASDLEPSVRLHLGSALLERLFALNQERPVLVGATARVGYLKQSGFDRLLGETFHFPEARIASLHPAATTARYLWLGCRYVATSDEQREGLFRVFLGLDGALFTEEDQRRALFAIDLEYKKPALGGMEIEAILPLLEPRLRPIVERHVATFREQMERRLLRDLAGLRDYYRRTHRDMQAGLGRSTLNAELQATRQQKLASLPSDFANKRQDLLKKYTLTVTMRCCAALVLDLPVVKVAVALQRGRENLKQELTYQPLLKGFEPLRCRACGTATTVIAHCRQGHLLCPSCRPTAPCCH